MYSRLVIVDVAYEGIKMSFSVSIISTILKLVISNKVENELVNDLTDIWIGEISEKGVNKLSEFLEVQKTKVEYILSKENIKSMEISEDKIEFVIAEIKDLLLKIRITDEVFEQCRYNEEKFRDFLWSEYHKYKQYTEYESDMKKGLYIVAKELISVKCESKAFEKQLLIQISNSVNDTNKELQEMSDCIVERFDKLEKSNQAIYNKISENSNTYKNVKQKVKLRTSEYLNKWNKNMFLNNFDKRDENAGVNIKLSEVYLESYLPHYIWKSNSHANKDIKKLLFEYINKDADDNVLLVLGQPGIGKSTLITWITANINSIGNSIENLLIFRFASDLKNIDWNHASENFNILYDVLCALNLDYSDICGKVLILDGLDEVNISSDRADILNKLFQMALVNGNFSLIVTCRENYISDLSLFRYSYIILQGWDAKQIESFCMTYKEKNKSNISQHTLDVILKNKKILGIPLILYMVLALNIDIKEEGSIVDVYDKIFSLNGGIYDRCIDKIVFDEPHWTKEIKEHIHQVSREMAIKMFENNPNEAIVPKEEYLIICNKILKEQPLKNKVIEQDLLMGTYFKSVKHCEGIETENIYFVHRSIYEYFVAEYIFASMRKNISSKEKLAEVLGDLLKGNKLRISHEIIEFLEYKIKNSELNQKFDIIFKTFELMLQDGMTYYTNKKYKNIVKCEMNVFANMLEIIHLWKIKGCLNIDGLISNYLHCYTSELNLSNLNLSGLDLMGVNLMGTNLQEANLSKAYLVGVNLAKANLQKADLRYAELFEVYLNKSDIEGAILDSNQMNYIREQDNFEQEKNICLQYYNLFMHSKLLEDDSLNTR